MSTWDTTTPLNTESEKLGDDRIRDAKSAFQEAMQVESIFPGTDLANPICRRAPLKGTTAARPTATVAYAGRWYFNSTTKTLQRNTTAPGWEDIAAPYDIIPAASTMIFYQSAAPTGWAQITTYNDYTIRIVSGSGLGTGGTGSISSPPTHAHGSGATASANASHSHAFPWSGSSLENTGIGFASLDSGLTSVSTENVVHTHTLPSTSVQAWAPGYIDVVIATKT